MPFKSVWNHLRLITPTTLATAIVAFIFSTTAPFALIIASTAKGGLGEAEIASWVFGGFFINGCISVVFSLYYRQPLIFLWTMPGTVLVGQALTHMSLAEAVGAYVVTAVLVLLLGLSGMVRRVMQAIPMPIVMAMVAGVFLQFSLDWILAFQKQVLIVAPMTAVFFALMMLPRLARAVPPLIAALIVGAGMAIWTGHVNDVGPLELAIQLPHFTMPVFSAPALIELVIPIAITVLVVQNGQGIGVLTTAGHTPPINPITITCGVSALMTSTMGAVTSCLAGPVTAILVSAEERERQYMSAVIMGIFCIGFGLTAPFVTRLSLAAPKEMIATLAGLAMLKILQTAFIAAFKDRYSFSALLTFVVTVSGITIANIGSPFWGIVVGYVCAKLVEREG